MNNTEQNKLRKRLKNAWSVLRAKHYAVLLADTQEEISWAIETLRKEDENARRNE